MSVSKKSLVVALPTGLFFLAVVEGIVVIISVVGDKKVLLA